MNNPGEAVDTDQVHGSTPNGRNAISDAIVNLIGNNPDMGLLLSPENAMITSGSSMQNSTPLIKKISDEHYKWFTSVHNCWMGHRGYALHSIFYINVSTSGSQ